MSPTQWRPRFFSPGVQRTWCSPPSNAEGKNRRISTFALPIRLNSLDTAKIAFNCLLFVIFLVYKIPRVCNTAAENTKEQETVILNVLHDFWCEERPQFEQSLKRRASSVSKGLVRVTLPPLELSACTTTVLKLWIRVWGNYQQITLFSHVIDCSEYGCSLSSILQGESFDGTLK